MNPTGPLSGSTPLLPRSAQPVYQSRVFFEYLGRTGMTVIGPVTGKRYRFEGPGARVEVDLRDRRSVAALPQLRQLQPGDFPTAR